MAHYEHQPSVTRVSVLKWMARVMDFLLLPLGGVALLSAYGALRSRRRVPHATASPGRNLLILSPSGVESVKARGTEHLESLDNPFFDRIIFLCPGSAASHEVQLSRRMTLMDVPHPGWIRSLRRAGFPYFSFLLGQAVSLGRLCDLVKKHDIGVIRSMEPHNMGVRGVLLKRILSVRHIQDVRANFDLIFLGTGKAVWLPSGFPRWANRLSRKMEKAVERFVYRNSDLVFGGNKNNLDYAVYCGARLERSAVARVNIQPDLFEDLSGRKSIRSGLGAAGKLVLYCGRLSPEKYAEDVLRAFHELAERRRDVTLVIVGDGPQRPKLEATAGEKGLAGRVRFMGYRDNRFLKDLFVSVDVIVCPLAGSVLVEAALAALPVVAYDFEWHSEIVVDGYSGLLVNFRDVRGLAEAIAFLLDNPEAGASCGRRAREIAVSLFLPAHILAKEERLYASLFR
jgi:glycosyltransferase involved in cell wall biosynthesis